MARGDMTTVEAIYQTQTAKAFCVHRDEDDNEDIWLAFSLAFLLTTGAERGDVVEVELPEWLAEQEGLT